MRRVLKYDLICTVAMVCVAAGVALNMVYLQVLSSAGPSGLVLIPVAIGLATPFATWAVRRLVIHARHSLFMEAMGVGAMLYLFGSGALSASLPFLLQPSTAP
jgi:hypothetical protein